jgi:hypothetical protein
VAVACRRLVRHNVFRVFAAWASECESRFRQQKKDKEVFAMNTYYRIVRILAGWIGLLIAVVSLLISGLALLDLTLHLRWGYTWWAFMIGLAISGVALVARQLVRSFLKKLMEQLKDRDRSQI